VLGEQLAGFADAAPADLDRLGARVAELGELAARVDAAVPGLVAAAGAFEQARAAVGAVVEEREVVSAVRMPAGMEEVARGGRGGADGAEADATGAADAARAAHEAEVRAERDVLAEVERVRRERELVSAVRVPEGLAGVAEAMTRADAELAAAVARVVAAERAD